MTAPPLATSLAIPPKREPTIKIWPPKKWAPINFSELWHYRELLYSFVARDVKIRYKQTALGFLWVIIQPLFLVVVFTLFSVTLLKSHRKVPHIHSSPLPPSSHGHSLPKGLPGERRAW